MCGRTGLTLKRNEIQCACSYKPSKEQKYVKPHWLDEHNDGKEYKPSYNIAPTDVTPVLISSSKYSAQTSRVLKPMMWGIIPPWHKDDYKNHNLSTNNCRIENVKNSKLYHPILMNGGRCVIVVEGFYEWQTTIKAKVKQPYYIYSKQDDNVLIDDPKTWNNIYDDGNGWKGVKLLYMAGLYNVWQRNETVMYSYSVITMESNNTFDWLHHRMPAILDTEEQIDCWLDIENVHADAALACLKPVQALVWHPVSTLVNNAKNKEDICNKRVETKNKAAQKTLTDFFSKGVKRKSNEDSVSECKMSKK
ncbi:abasic site processing protein HMCES [Aricia agestis]|uniref:abasic site processing protein HMCES n=1 Tax=Aricia agestis TaxID=91739 RepID=UPI001C2094C2|nr:abasic site processing protein HMCES [Aricia agestis]